MELRKYLKPESLQFFSEEALEELSYLESSFIDICLLDIFGNKCITVFFYDGRIILNFYNGKTDYIDLGAISEVSLKRLAEKYIASEKDVDKFLLQYSIMYRAYLDGKK